MTEPIWINLRVIKAFKIVKLMSMATYLAFVMSDYVYLPYQGPRKPHYSDPKPDVAEPAAAYGFGLAKIIRQ